MADNNTFFIILIILLALGFDFTNGIHDSANSIATVVSTRVLTPTKAVLWAAFFNFVSFFIFGTAVASTIGKGMIDIKIVTPPVIFCALAGAIIWNLITWYMALPTSSSHALIGGYAGAAVAKAGFGVIITGGWTKTLVFIVLAPVIGMVLGFFLRILLAWLIYKRKRDVVNPMFRHSQLFSAALYSLGHGSNDAQKTMGIITSLLFSAGWISDFRVPDWVVLCSYSVIALGTMMGGWKIVKTMGQKIARLQPIDGFCAESSSALSIFLATYLGVPVSTTHVITGAISGTASAKRPSSVRWNVAIQIVWAWLFTIPAAALIGALAYFLFGSVLGK